MVITTLARSTKKKKKEDKLIPATDEFVGPPKPEEPKKDDAPKKEPQESQPQVFRDEQGELRGVKTRTGQVLLGMQPEEVRAYLAFQQQKMETPAGAVEASSVAKQQQAEKYKEQLMGEYPQESNLTPESRPGGNIPVVGGLISSFQNVIIQKAKEGDFGPVMQGFVNKGGLISPETLRTKALTEIEDRVYNEGVSDSEKFGALVESIPLVTKYGDIETPVSNIDTIMDELRVVRRKATKYETWSRSGAISPNVAIQNIRGIENKIQELESRIKLLTNFSPKLKFNSDKINLMEEEIFLTKEILFEAKLRAAEGTAAPDDSYIYQALEDLDKDFGK